jgi:endonuclease YncB( thermonuclease family)
LGIEIDPRVSSFEFKFRIYGKSGKSDVRQDVNKLLQRLFRGQLSRNRRRRGMAPIVLSIVIIGVLAFLKSLEEPDSPLPPRGAELSCSVSKVYDGDTVTASCEQGKLKVRVYGIDAPEMGQKPWGERSRDLMRGMIPSDEVMLQIMDIDRYGRVVARILHGNQDLGLRLVREGGAVVYERYNEFEVYRAAQLQARQERVGIWSESGPHQEPWEWRKLNPRG